MPPSLSQTERWMKAVILHTGSVEDALKSRPATLEIPASKMPVLPSDRMTAHERVDVYREIYWLRLREALSIDYPELKRLLGDGTFDALCDAYVDKYPSRSYTLNRLGDRLPRFLAAGGFPPLRRLRPFATDLARLELLMTEVFDEAEAPVLDEAQVAQVPADAWETVRLRAIPALRCGEFRYPVSHWISAKRDDKPADAFLKRKDSRVIVSRRAHAVYRLEVTRPAYLLFQELVSGKTMGDAMSSVRITPSLVQQSFQSWVANRVFRRLD